MESTVRQYKVSIFQMIPAMDMWKKLRKQLKKLK